MFKLQNSPSLHLAKPDDSAQQTSETYSKNKAETAHP